jgi:hypothetical protein
LYAEQTIARGGTSSRLVRLPSSPFTCRGCGSDTTPGAIDRRVCGECLERTCPTCQRYGGGHSPGCSLRPVTWWWLLHAVAVALGALIGWALATAEMRAAAC